MAIKLNEIFYSIQSEGPLAGTPAFFIRTAGCNLGKDVCSFCDTDYRYRYSMAPEAIAMKLDRITEKCFGGPTTVVITGGEPFLQKQLPDLIWMLTGSGYKVQVETNGTVMPVTDNPVGIQAMLAGATIVCSPKLDKVNRDLRYFISSWKYVVGADTAINPDYGLPMYLFNAAADSFKIPQIYLQPRDDHDEKLNMANNKRVLGLCLKYNYKLSLQYHKLMKVR